jgi:hypothetical protein
MVYSATMLVDLFRSTTMFRSSPIQGLLPLYSCTLSSSTLTPMPFQCVYSPRSPESKQAAIFTSSAPRLCSAQRSVPFERCLAVQTVAPLFRFSASPGRFLDNKLNYLNLDAHAVDHFGLLETSTEVDASSSPDDSTPTFYHLIR